MTSGHTLSMTSTIPGSALLPRTGMTLDEARLQLSGLHFAKEALSEGEREILHIAEALLRVIDGEPVD